MTIPKTYGMTLAFMRFLCFTVLFLAMLSGICGEAIKLPLEKGKTERTESGTPIYDFPSLTCALTYPALLKQEITVPGKIRFKVRTKQFSDRKGGCHFGIRLYTGNDQSIMFFSRRRGVSVIVMKNNTRAFLAEPRNGFLFSSGNKMSEWADVEIRINRRMTEVSINSKTERTIPFGGLPLRKIEPYSYFVDYEMTEPVFIPDPPSQETASRKDPVFHLSFENGLTAKLAPHAEAQPQKQQGLRFTDGISGKALLFSSRSADGEYTQEVPLLIYDGKGLFRNEGTLSFWFRPDWDGQTVTAKGLPTYQLICGTDGSNKEKLNINMWHWLRFDLGRLGKSESFSLRRNGRDEWFRGDFHHLALVWKDGGWNKAYIDGIPFEQPWNPAGKLASQLDLASITSFSIGSGRFQRGDGAYDEIKIYDRPLSADEICAEYRKSVPADLLLFKNHVVVGKPDFLTLLVSPGGSSVVPRVGTSPSPKSKITLVTRLRNRRDGSIIPLGTHSLDVNREIRLKLPLPALPTGFWVLQAEYKTASGSVQRSFAVASSEEPGRTDPGEIRKGELLFEQKFTAETVKTFPASGPVRFLRAALGDYAEAGREKGDRFSFEVSFPKRVLNKKICLLEVDWPDDKARTMGIYLYVESKAPMHRDRVGGGLLAGEEYPNSFRMQTAKYLFYPGKEHYLFEARTMVSGMPAAVSAVRIYELENEKLPSLALQRPQGLPSRSFGFFDEDQSFNQTMNYDNAAEMSSPMRYKYILDRLAEYLDYVGKDAFTNPFFRYMGRQYPSFSAMTNRDWNYTYLTEFLGRRGKKVYATLDVKSLPHLRMDPESLDGVESSDLVMRTDDGTACKRFIGLHPNPVHPAMRKALLEEVSRVAELYGNVPGFAGICLWSESLLFAGLDAGYDDTTVAKFTKDTKITVPFRKMTERKTYLTHPERLNTWLKWRAEQGTVLFREMAETLRKQNPNLVLILMFEQLPLLLRPEVWSRLKNLPASLIAEHGGDASAAFYQEYGLDLASLNRIPGIATRPLRIYNFARHTLHWGKAPSSADRLLYDNSINRLLLTSRGGVCSFPAYFETFTEPLRKKQFNSYFQNADLKPHGRFFLKELVYPVYVADTQSVMFGAQPFASWGHEAETREFARAFCALPAREFRTAKGETDPVTVRYLNTPEGTWFYAVSMLNGDADVLVRFSVPGAVCRDLSTHAALAGDKIRLKAYQLRSFFSPVPDLKIETIRIQPDQSVISFYEKQIAGVVSAASRLRQEKLLSKQAEQAINRLSSLVQKSRYAELDTVLFSLPVREVRTKRDSVALLREQADMAKRGHYAVNCGSTAFLKTKNGTLFAPDCLWNGTYGHFGSYDSVAREVSQIRDPDAALYRNEAYNIDGYRFALPNGSYKLRLYTKIGFKRNAAPGYYQFDILANGKLLVKDFDVYTACDGDLDRTVVREYGPVKVANGTLEISLQNHQKRPWARLMNAIEVIRQ